MNKPVERKSVWMVILLSVVTLGIYIPYWLYQRLDAFNQMKSTEKLDKNIVMAVLVMYSLTTVMYIVSTISEMMYPENISFVTNIDNVGSVIDFVSTIMMLYLAFRTRKVIEDHFKITLSGVATFFFSIYYLQYKINKQLSKAESGAPTQV